MSTSSASSTATATGPLAWAGLTIVLAAAYVVTGYAASWLMFPPGNTSILWLPAGIALAAVIMRGWQAVPGIFIGAAAVNGLLLSESGGLASVPPFAVLAIALGSTLQPLAAAALLRRFNLTSNAFADVSSIGRSLAIVGLSCVISALFGAATLTALNLVPAAEAAQTWGTWWLGDLLGVQLMTPIVLALRRKAALTAVLLTLVFAVGIGGTYFTSSGIRSETEDGWNELAATESARLTSTLLRRIETSLAPIHAVAALFESSSRIFDDEF